MTVEGKHGVATPGFVRSGKQNAVRSSIKEDRRQLLIGACNFHFLIDALVRIVPVNAGIAELDGSSKQRAGAMPASRSRAGMPRADIEQVHPGLQCGRGTKPFSVTRSADTAVAQI